MTKITSELGVDFALHLESIKESHNKEVTVFI